jgi:hypothetical protein
MPPHTMLYFPLICCRSWRGGIMLNNRFSSLGSIWWPSTTYLTTQWYIYAARIEDKHNMIHRAGVLYLSDAWLHCIYILLPSESSSVHDFIMIVWNISVHWPVLYVHAWCKYPARLPKVASHIRTNFLSSIRKCPCPAGCLPKTRHGVT